MRISIVIPTCNEAYTINETVSHLQRIEFSSKPEIIVVDGRGCGNTLEAVESGDVLKTVSEKGRGGQMNAGAKMASGDVLLFLHADTRLPENAISCIENVLEDRAVVAGAFDLGIDSEKPAYRLIESMVYARTRLTGIPYGDQGIFIRRRFFEKTGGYADIPLMEDVDLMRRVRKEGGRIAVVPIYIRTSARRWEREGLVFCTLRNWALVSLYFLGVSPGRLAGYYRQAR